MEYASNQTVIYEWLGKSFTGKIVGQNNPVNFIVLLDSPLHNGTRAVCVPSDIIRPLVCHWCQDTKKVNVQSFTGLESDIPQKDCPYCCQ